jgi:hypothetical protein
MVDREVAQFRWSTLRLSRQHASVDSGHHMFSRLIAEPTVVDAKTERKPLQR